MHSEIGSALHGESSIFNDEHKNSKVSGVRSNRYGEWKIDFAFPET